MIKKVMNNKVVQIIVKIIKAILTIFIVALAAVIIVQRLSNNRVSIGGIKLFTVVTGSMVPKYNVGDMLIAKEIAAKDLKVGDDLVYIGKVGDFKGKIITHEIINIGQNDGKYEFVTKGIANTEEDPTVYGDQIYGKVIYKSVVLSWCSKVMNNTYGFYFIIFVPMVILIFFDIMQEIEYHKKAKPYNLPKE